MNAKQITMRYLHLFALVFEWASWVALDHLNTGAVHPQKKFSHYLISLMLMESEAKFISPPNISGASQQNGVAAFS